ncbi:MAG: hypothetical protein A3F82_07965 [Deltaproteobacteria bacterium RIFCSPLOWO2_12_FULL_44_12]|nr:MAG: hypothetical protein A2712_07305 [Deltaproteobacteria bacterium RIFCSPHIGHO2_01_FULL_43_49]OGQ15751.1 MAG: hypothetical protein A3D22_06095 [Deltaproteobacteria bacterium RIFCSPHIGHO2_02_FULL_44_53]OGQ28720.1 MAG: hypothetical protein A3D98_00830 [Deltaproteobacteria bacterium RIFCSPHIGHO2_12_FULL_44_21]OGQ32044.1 MAG: hypothetical protein A2979_03040 [Deltaproteobacteria bacterium RIFCSPLOWO2_01_FULL_45_74]OGQ43655.1 MAG: hypothetical protein A3I70_03555 [Deltaproteobacteria bacterium 
MASEFSNSSQSSKAALLHKIKNCLAPLQTFLDVIDTSKEEPKLQKFHQTCIESFNEVKTLLKKLEEG